MRCVCECFWPIVSHLDVGSIVGFAGHVTLLLQQLKFEAQMVNWDGVLPSVILEDTWGHRGDTHVCVQ